MAEDVTYPDLVVVGAGLFGLTVAQQAVEKAENGEEPIPVTLLEVFENVAYLMARHANPQMPEHSVEEWLDSFNTFSIYEVFPELLELWRANNGTLAESKKKRTPLTGK